MSGVGFGNRREAALRAMAGQSVSPEEARIAREKLRLLKAKAERDDEAEWRQAWADQKEHERIAERLAVAAGEAEIAAIVKRWERGTFSGLTVDVGAVEPERRYR